MAKSEPIPNPQSPIPNIQYPISNLSSPCRIHNGGMPQSEPTLAVCLDADRLDLGRVGITPDPLRLSTFAAKAIASGLPIACLSHQLGEKW